MLLGKKAPGELLDACYPFPSILKKCIICESQESKVPQNEVCLYLIHRNSRRGERSECTFKAIMAENFPNQGIEMNTQIFGGSKNSKWVEPELGCNKIHYN